MPNDFKLQGSISICLCVLSKGQSYGCVCVYAVLLLLARQLKYKATTHMGTALLSSFNSHLVFKYYRNYVNYTNRCKWHRRRQSKKMKRAERTQANKTPDELITIDNSNLMPHILFVDYLLFRAVVMSSLQLFSLFFFIIVYISFCFNSPCSAEISLGLQWSQHPHSRTMSRINKRGNECNKKTSFN